MNRVLVDIRHHWKPGWYMDDSSQLLYSKYLGVINSEFK